LEDLKPAGSRVAALRRRVDDAIRFQKSCCWVLTYENDAGAANALGTSPITYRLQCQGLRGTFRFRPSPHRQIEKSPGVNRMSEPNQPDELFLEGDPDLDKIVLDLDTAGRELPVEAIREARRYRNEIVPKLIAVLQEASAKARSGEKREGQAPFFSEAYRQGLVETILVTLEDVERNIAEGEAGFRRWQERCEPTGIADTIVELETWAAFRKEPPPRPSAKPPLRRVAPSLKPLPPPEPPVRRVGRNEPCPCGSGKKFKKCCGSRHM